MSRKWALVAGCLAIGASSARAEEYVPPAATDIPNYYTTPFACSIRREDRTMVTCKDQFLEKKSLRELAILRNTIYARYGWDGFRKPWLKAYFHAQPWFKPNAKFTYKLINEVDKKNAHFIGTFEQSLTSMDLAGRQERILSPNGKTRPVAALSADDKIELGLIARASGGFALDGQESDAQTESVDRLFRVAELRQLSLRDLRVLRNTIYARKGRPFKSQILQDHFNGMDWYKINPAYSDKLLTRNDTRNIALIKSVENEFGGPISDEEWLHEPASDGA